MNLARTKISLLGLLLVCTGFAVIQGGCQKQDGPEHTVAMTPGGPDKPIMKEVRAADNSSEYAEVPKPVAFDPTSTRSNDPAPLTDIDRSANNARFYRVKADDTYWKIAVKELGNGQRWREIESLNAGINPSSLKIGQTIRIPVR